MDSIQQFLNSMQKQTQSLQDIALRMNSFKNIAEIINKQNQPNYNLSGVSNITEIAKKISSQLKPFNSSVDVLNNNFFANLGSQQLEKNNFALTGLSNSLIEIAKYNQQLSERLSGFASSQIILSNNLTRIAKMISQSHLQKFNSIEIALQGISKTYLKDIAKNHNWEDIKIAENTNDVISLKTNEYINSSKQTSLLDLDELKISIIKELFEILTKTKTEKGVQYILNLIAVIGFLITLYSSFHKGDEKSNQDVIIETRKEIEKANKELSLKIEFELDKLNKTRIALVDVKLRYSTKNKSKVIGFIKKGQQVSVIEIRHKYLLISYLDKDTGEPKSGFVVKKYFESK